MTWKTFAFAAAGLAFVAGAAQARDLLGLRSQDPPSNRGPAIGVSGGG